MSEQSNYEKALASFHGRADYPWIFHALLAIADELRALRERMTALQHFGVGP